MNNPTIWTFVSLMGGDEKQEFPTFKEAFICMFNWVEDRMEKGGLSFQVIETAIWIETPNGTPLDFYDSRDIAYEAGIMNDGELVK